MNRMKGMIAGLLLALPLAGCANDITGTPSGTAASAPYVYKLGPDDRVRITVYNEPNLTGEYSVGSEGQISFPLVGRIKAQGLTVGEFSDALTKELDAHYFKDPHVVVDMVTTRPVYVLGEVNKAGQYPYQSGMTVLGAVATAGGFTYRANQKTVMVRHNGAAAEERAPLTADLIVQPGDTIRIRERHF